MRRIHGPVQEVADEALLAGMADGDEQAALAFVRRYQRRVFGLAYSMVNNASVAEEIAQEALLRAWRHAPVFDPRRGSVATWLLTITRNLTIDWLRVRRSAPVEPEQLSQMLGPDPTSEIAFGRSDQATLVRSALATLPREQQRAIVLSGLYGYTAEEVSRTEGIPLGTAKSRIRAGLAKLHNELTSTEGNT